MPELPEAEAEALAIAGYFVRDRFLSEADARAAHAFALGHLEVLKPATFGQGYLDPAIRGDSTGFLDESPVHGAFTELMNALNESLRLGLKNFQTQLGYYPANGAKYVRHLDAMPGMTTRRITALLYLNPEWQSAHGGQLRLHVDPVLDVAPEMNRLVVFSSERIEHEVMPSFAPRMTLTAWYRTRDALGVERPNRTP